MSAQLLSGRAVSKAILAGVRADAEHLIAEGIVPTLAVFRAGEDPGSLSYEKSIAKTLADCRIKVIFASFQTDVTREAFAEEIKKAAGDKSIHGILVLKPLPAQIGEDAVRELLPPEKDLDALNPASLGKLLITDGKAFCPCGAEGVGLPAMPGAGHTFSPCGAEGVLELLRYYNIDVEGKDITIINNSETFGKPLAAMLTGESATVTVCHRGTRSCAKYTRESDIVITGCGEYGLLTPDMLREDAVVIDVAMAWKTDAQNKCVTDEKGRRIRTGDCREDCAEACAMITSATPGCGGGTGPVTTSLLARHLIEGCRRQMIL